LKASRGTFRREEEDREKKGSVVERIYIELRSF
jgi:hypothetical protein